MRNAPGRVRDAIIQVLSSESNVLSIRDIEKRVQQLIGSTPESSVRSYLRLNTPGQFIRETRGFYRTRQHELPGIQRDPNKIMSLGAPFSIGQARLFLADCFDWIRAQQDHSIHAVVTDPPFGLFEYSPEQQTKLRNGKGGVWRIPPAFDGHTRSPLPRFTTLTREQLGSLRDFFYSWGTALLPKLVPGAHMVIASNALVSYIVSGALAEAGLERRGEIIRLTMTMRGGDRPKAAHLEFSEVSVIPRSMWEPWIIFRKAIEGRVQDNLRKWKTGGFRRPSGEKPFGDVVVSAPTRSNERALAPHPSLKPQAFLRQIVRAVLPLGEGIVLDPFAGAGSTLAAAEAVGYSSIGVEKDPYYYDMACTAIPKLTNFQPNGAPKVYKSNSLGAS